MLLVRPKRNSSPNLSSVKLPKLLMKKSLFLFLTAFLLLPNLVSAHAVGMPPFFEVNGEYAGYYNVPLSSQTINLPQDLAPHNYLIGVPIHLLIDSSALQLPVNIIDNTDFAWDFGDGTTGKGLKNDHTYSAPGSYIINITAAYKTDPPQLIESALLQVVPDSSYLPPVAIIKANDKITTNPINDPIICNFKSPVSYDASSSTSSSPIVKYLWDFGDTGTSNSATTSHTYQPTTEVMYPILRVVDSKGFYSDAFVELETDSQGEAKMPIATASTQIKPTAFPVAGNFLYQTYYRVNNTSRNMVNQMFSNKNSSPIFLLSVIFFVFFAGSLHALTPGHGKSVMAAFLVGKSGSRFKDTITLALSITITHTLLIFILGFVFLVLDKNHTLTSSLPFFEKGGAIIVVILSFNLIRNGINSLRHRYQHSHDLEHHHHHHDEAPITNRSLLLAGFSGGIVPCTDAFALLLLTASAGHVALGLVLVTIFSLGLSLTIISLGLFIIAGKNSFHLDEKLGQIGESYLPIASGLFLLALSLRILLV